MPKNGNGAGLEKILTFEKFPLTAVIAVGNFMPNELAPERMEFLIERTHLIGD